MFRKSVSVNLVALAFLMLIPAAAVAQVGIAGEVKDTTGAMLPGVTVEASSPALIEKVRTVVTDDRGQYKIIDLRPGVYSVTFTLPGFSSVRREGIELSGSFTATVNAEMRVGAVEETVTVTGQSPVVDVQNVIQNRVVTRDVIDALPTGRTFQNFAAVIPGIQLNIVASTTAQDVGGTQSQGYHRMSMHGSAPTDMQQMIDGILNNNSNSLGFGAGLIDTGSMQEYNYQLGAISADTTTGGVHVNMIPKEGGNRFSGSFFGAYTNKNLQWDNTTDVLRARGLPAATKLEKIYDVNPSFGGPIKRDKLWFYLSTRAWGNDDGVPGAYYDKDPKDVVYTPDLTRPAINDSWLVSASLRPTWQVTPKNKLVSYGQVVDRCLCHNGQLSSTVVAEATTYARSTSVWESVLWTSPVSNRLLLEAGGSWAKFTQAHYPQKNVTPDMLAVTELSTGLRLRAPASMDVTYHGPIVNYKATLAYVTGTHAFKAGFNLQRNQRSIPRWINGDIILQLLNGIPSSVVVNTTPNTSQEKLNAALGLFAQDQWTLQRLTLNLGVRFDYHNASVPAQQQPAGRFVAARSFAEVPDVPNWKDVVPRLGASYDLFGNGKTALKVTLNRYVNGELFFGITPAVNPVTTTVNSATRTWNDLNGDFIPQENELGPLSNASFGQVVVRTRYDDAYRTGYGSRGFNWETSAVIQHELAPNVSVDVGYFRRWYGNLTVIDNLATAPTDYDPFCITVPVDSRLPGGGGNQLCGLYDVTPLKFGQVNNLVTYAKNFGNWTNIYNGVDLTMNARLPGRANVSGGVNIGRQESNNCDVVLRRPNILFAGPTAGVLESQSSQAFCDTKPPFQSQVKFIVVYPLPWWGLQASGTVQSLPGPEILAAYVATSAQIQPSLGRNLAAGARGTATIDLVPPATLYGDRLNQVDFRVSKIVRVGRLRIQGNLDLYNLLNASPVLLQNNTFGPLWQRPQYVLPGRLFKFGAQVDL